MTIDVTTDGTSALAGSVVTYADIIVALCNLLSRPRYVPAMRAATTTF
jgi:hypothetical protein